MRRDQIALGRSTLLFGSHAEITQRKSLLRIPSPPTVVPLDMTWGDSGHGSNLEVAVNQTFVLYRVVPKP